MRVLVCGSRNYSNKDELYSKLTALHLAKPITCIISGMASGADSLAIGWACCNKIDYEQYPAEWHKYGKSAGFVRNKRMLKEGKPDVVVATTGGRGTLDMIGQALAASIEVLPCP